MSPDTKVTVAARTAQQAVLSLPCLVPSTYLPFPGFLLFLTPRPSLSFPSGHLSLNPQEHWPFRFGFIPQLSGLCSLERAQAPQVAGGPGPGCLPQAAPAPR